MQDSWLASLVHLQRQKRFGHFLALLNTLPRPIRVLDIGGEEKYWRQVNGDDIAGVSITLLNLEKIPTTISSFTAVVGDAKDMSEFMTAEFDVVFSNSVIEHVGDINDQRRMAREVRRVGKRYYVQTPNRFFPIEPHFLLPFFQFYPFRLKTWLFLHFEFLLAGRSIGWRRASNPLEADQMAQSIRLLSEHELCTLFPGGQIWREKILGLTKSLIIYDGWN
jgi:SAM-dependent methyltransferase